LNRSTTKKIVWTVLIFGLVWTSSSYVLAFLGREQIAAELSERAVECIVGTVLAYCVKSLAENLHKYPKGGHCDENSETETREP